MGNTSERQSRNGERVPRRDAADDEETEEEEEEDDPVGVWVDGQASPCEIPSNPILGRWQSEVSYCVSREKHLRLGAVLIVMGSVAGASDMGSSAAKACARETLLRRSGACESETRRI